jgi:hypothetical protein
VASVRRGAPDEATVALFVGPERRGAADDRIAGKRPEIPAVQAVGSARVHQKDLAAAKRPASLPGGEITPTAVMHLRLANLDMIDGDAEPVAADGLSRQRQNPLDQRQAARQVAAIGE